MDIQQRILRFIFWTNWILFIITSGVGLAATSFDFAKGIIFGGLIVTVNFHLLYRTLKKAFANPKLEIPSVNAILAKYYVRFLASGVILFFLIAGKIVNPLGLFIGLSIVVASIMLATIIEVTKLLFKEAS
jgi:hypothetical protein